MEILTAASAPDFLAMVPTLVGGSVERSVVFVPFSGKRTFPTACRVDLPPRERRADVRTVVHGALGVLSRIPNADRVDVVVYTDRSFAGERGIPHLELGRAAAEGLRRAGFHVGLAACVAADGWGDYLDRTHREAGYPLEEIERSEVAARVRELGVGRDSVGLREREVPDADPVARLAVARVLGREPDDPDVELVRLEREAPLVDLLELVLVGHREPAVIAIGLTLLESPAARDVGILHYAFGREVGHAAAVDASRWTAIQRETGQSMDDLVEAELAAGGASGAEWGDLLMGRTSRTPDRARLGEAVRMLRSLVAHAPDELRPGPLTMLGWCLWAMGSTSAAGAMLDRAVALAPGDRMAAMLRTWVDAGALTVRIPAP